jgi:SM-20-related protein
MQATSLNSSFFDGSSDDGLFAKIAQDIEIHGYSINVGALPEELGSLLWHHQSHMHADAFQTAGVGRAAGHQYDNAVRSDEICWINGESLAGASWLRWSADLQQYLNRRLFLGLFSFESHFSHYEPGAYYRRHFDAFIGEANRVLSLVVYLNREWGEQDGGELVLYRSDTDSEGVRVLPNWGTVAVFLSEVFSHEVLPARRDRYSVAGWYRLNTSTSGFVDPSL